MENNDSKLVWVTHDVTPKWLTENRKVKWRIKRVIDTSRSSRVMRRVIQIKQWRKNYRASYFWILPGKTDVQKNDRVSYIMDSSDGNESESDMSEMWSTADDEVKEKKNWFKRIIVHTLLMLLISFPVAVLVVYFIKLTDSLQTNESESDMSKIWSNDHDEENENNWIASCVDDILTLMATLSISFLLENILNLIMQTPGKQ